MIKGHLSFLFNVNKLIINNIGRFGVNDLIDLKKCYSPEELQLINLDLTSMQISKVTDWDLQTRITSKGIDYIRKNYKNYVEKNKKTKKK